MNKKILLVLVIAMLGIANNAYSFNIFGNVHVIGSNIPVPNHAVYITDSISFYHVVYTDSTGFYQDTVTPYSGMMYVSTFDCNNLPHVLPMNWTGNGIILSILPICYSNIDAGLLSIIYPDQTTTTGDTIAPKIKIKNYGNQPITSLQLGYKIFQHPTVIENWTGNLLQDSSIIYTFSTKYITPSSNYNIIAFTHLYGDTIIINDTINKYIGVTPALLDAGVTEILSPLNQVQTGDYIPIKVKIKNYGTQTLTNLQINYKINGQLMPAMNWAGSLAHDSLNIVTLGSYFVSNANGISLIAFTNLNGDMYHPNDTAYNFIYVVPQYDAGVIEIISPSSTSTTSGDFINPKIKIKNYGNQVITSMNLGCYRPNFYYPVFETWNGNLQPDSTVIYTFTNGYFTPSTNYTMIAFTGLALDSVKSNDTLFKPVVVNPAQLDVAVIEIKNPSYFACGGSSLVKVTIKNNGLTPLSSIPVSYRRGIQPAVSEIWTGGPLQYGDTIQYSFAQPMTIPIGTSFSMCAYTTLLNDANIHNDTTYKSVLIYGPISQLSIVGEDTVVIGQNNVRYIAYPFSNIPNVQYIWILPSGALLDSSSLNSIFVNYGSNAISGNITCKSITLCSVTPTANLSVHVFATPPAPIIHVAGTTLYSNYGVGNQWFNAGGAISGAVQQSYVPTVVGDYYTRVTLAGITSAASNVIHFPFVGIEETVESFGVKVFPNPLTSFTTFYYSLKENTLVRLSILDITGKEISVLYENKTDKGDHQIDFNAENLKNGIYFYRFKIGKHNINNKLIICK